MVHAWNAPRLLDFPVFSGNRVRLSPAESDRIRRKLARDWPEPLPLLIRRNLLGHDAFEDGHTSLVGRLPEKDDMLVGLSSNRATQHQEATRAVRSCLQIK